VNKIVNQTAETTYGWLYECHPSLHSSNFIARN